MIDMGLLCNFPASCGQLGKIIITLEPQGVYVSKFAYLFILILSSHSGMQNSDKGLSSINFADQGILVKLLINLETLGIKFCVLIHFNIIETQVC